MSEHDGKPAPGATPFTAEDAMAFMQRMWNPFAMPIPGAAHPGAPVATAATSGASAPGTAGFRAGAGSTTSAADAGASTFGAAPAMFSGMLPFPNPAAMFAALDPAEVERKIGELKVIEGWLAMSLNLVQMSVKTLELQLASLEALQGANAPARRRRARRASRG
ncbi:MAG TPA: PhaM family polyhydroxyalkanoate granule multifunctional regulatory protein [Casimicrobiaceae bacterium]